jgi:hypothetical protein
MNYPAPLVVGLWLTAASLYGASPALTFVKTADLPDLGMRMKLMAEAVSSPPPPPKVYTYTFKQGEKTWTENLYAPEDLWRQAQSAGQWSGRHTNVLVLAMVRQPLPKGFEREHVSRDAYEEKLGAVTHAAAEWTPEDLAQWMADFAGASKATAEPVKTASSRLKPLVAYNLTGQDSRLAYLFRPNRQATGQSGAADGWFCALFDLNPDTDMDKARKAVEMDFLPSIAFVGPPRAAASGQAMPAQRAALGPAVAERSTEYQASRQQVIDSLRNMKDWWYAETPHYIVLANLKKGTGALFVEGLRTDLETLRGTFTACVPPRKPISAVSVIRVFATADEYVRYVGPARAWSGGMWMPDRKELLIRPMEEGRGSDKRAAMLSTAFHEAFHQYLFYALEGLETSVWFNEGHACFVEGADVSAKKVRIGENANMAPVVDDLIRTQTLDFARLLGLSHEEFYRGDAETLRRNYAMAWAFVYYLRRGAPLDPDSRYAKWLSGYVDALGTTGDAEKASADLLVRLDLGTFKADFLKFWTSSSQRSAARRGGPAPAAAH